MNYQIDDKTKHMIKWMNLRQDIKTEGKGQGVSGVDDAS